MHISVSYSNVFPRAKELHILGRVQPHLGSSPLSPPRLYLFAPSSSCATIFDQAQAQTFGQLFYVDFKVRSWSRITSTARSKEGGADHVRFSDPETGKVATFVGGIDP
jgi:hypothetical protein